MFYVKKSKMNHKITTCCIYTYPIRKHFAAITTVSIFIPSQ